MRMAWIVSVVVLLLGTGVLHSDARREREVAAAGAKPKDDGATLNYRLAVQARGMVKIVDGKFYVVARQRMIREEPGKDFGLVKRIETFMEVTSELVFGERKDLRERAEKLLGKTAVVSGTAEMVLVEHDLARRGVGATPTYTWEVEPKIAVTELKAAD